MFDQSETYPVSRNRCRCVMIEPYLFGDLYFCQHLWATNLHPTKRPNCDPPAAQSQADNALRRRRRAIPKARGSSSHMLRVLDGEGGCGKSRKRCGFTFFPNASQVRRQTTVLMRPSLRGEPPEASHRAFPEGCDQRLGRAANRRLCTAR